MNTSPPRHHYVIWQCADAGCGLRFPAAEYEVNSGRCPRCGGATRPAAAPLNVQERGRRASSNASAELRILLDNIRSTYNVGSIVRTADGAGVDHLYCCGITATPEHPRVAKTALGASETVPWSYHPNGPALAADLCRQGYALWALEAADRAENLLAIRREDLPPRLVLVAGHEVAGVDPAILDQCSRVLSLPMVGTKESLNVTVALGAAVYHLLHGRL